MMMSSVFDYLLKYAINLLKPNRPLGWRSIKTSKPSFLTSVGCMKGASDILKEMGYSVETSNSLEFPKGQTLPNKSKLYILAAELLMCKLEMARINSNPRLISSYRSARKRVKNDVRTELCCESSDEEFVDALNEFSGSAQPPIHSNLRHSKERSLADKQCAAFKPGNQHSNVGDDMGNNSYFGHNRINYNQPHRGTVNSSSAYPLKAGGVSHQPYESVNPRIGNPKAEFRGDRFNQPYGPEDYNISPHTSTQFPRFSSENFESPKVNMRPPEENVVIPAPSTFSPTNNCNFPADKIDRSGENQIVSAGSSGSSAGSARSSAMEMRSPFDGAKGLVEKAASDLNK